MQSAMQREDCEAGNHLRGYRMEGFQGKREHDTLAVKIKIIVSSCCSLKLSVTVNDFIRGIACSAVLFFCRMLKNEHSETPNSLEVLDLVEAVKKV